MGPGIVLRVCTKGGVGKSSLLIAVCHWAAGTWPGMSLTVTKAGLVMFIIQWRACIPPVPSLPVS